MRKPGLTPEQRNELTRPRKPTRVPDPPPAERLPPVTVVIYSTDRPKPKQSTRFTEGGRAFTKADVRIAERQLRDAMKAAREKAGITRPYLGLVKLEACWYLPYVSGEEADWAASGGEIQCCHVPDSGNLLKLAEDAFKGVDGLYLDDAQVGVHFLVKRNHWWTGACYFISLSDPPHDGQFLKRWKAYKRELAKVQQARKRKPPAHTLTEAVLASVPPEARERLKKAGFAS